MTGPEDSHSGTRPISVAELLAKNGTIGAPPVGGRRRRRRGNSDAVTVAELTGEIPIVAEDEDEADTESHRVSEHTDVIGPLPKNGAAAPEAEAEADYEAHLEARDVEPEPVEFEPRPHRPHYAHALRRHRPSGSGAEQMSPDPVIDDDDDLLDSTVDLAEPPEIDYEDDDAVDVEESGTEQKRSYLKSTLGPLFGGQTVADDIARRGPSSSIDDTDLEDFEDEAEVAPPSTKSALVQGAVIVGQCILAVAFGAGLFIAFDQLWKWNNIVALVLSVLVILGLVVGVRVVRKTEDIGSTLIAVAVGALVTLGPLALLQSG
ncbi:hypothetical protein [Mycobacterium hubeiense]|uniref:hypothetical protein n=1 Tax=Mycobacterium hubeiense TaxID=1867256 RepID=UPI000C7ECBA7|nr:hypothetical protein [Mycobacterium sp. QGD 101]